MSGPATAVGGAATNSSSNNNNSQSTASNNSGGGGTNNTTTTPTSVAALNRIVFNQITFFIMDISTADKTGEKWI